MVSKSFTIIDFFTDEIRHFCKRTATVEVHAKIEVKNLAQTTFT